MGFPRKACTLFLLATLLVGLGRIAILPPFEGADETAHYSRILAAAFPPEKMEDAGHIDESVYNYYPNGPMSYGWVGNIGMHRYDPRIPKGKRADKAYPDYHVFFLRPGMAGKYETIFRERPAPRAFAPAPTYNWQVQHPPAYYALMGAVARALPPDLTLHGRLFALRACGYLIAFAGFAAGTTATARHLARAGRADAATVTAFGAFYPFMMPSFFGDLTRLGNDTLLLAAFAAAWIFLLRHLRMPRDSTEWLGLGIALGAALLVKATMMPVAIGMLLFISVRNVRREGAKGLAPAAVAAGMAALLAAKWYGMYLTGRALASSGADVFARGWGKSLPLETAFSFAAESVYGAVFHFSDWFLVRFSPAIRIAAALPAAAAILSWAALTARRRALLSTEGLTFWTTGPLLGAVTLHSVFSAMTYGAEHVAPTSAYYVHAAAPALALCLGLGMAQLRGRPGGHAVVTALGLMAIWGTGYLFLRQAQMYGGCWWEDETNTYTGACFHDFFLLFHRLEVLSWPLAGVVFFTAGFACAVTGLALAVRDGVPVPVDAAPSGMKQSS